MTEEDDFWPEATGKSGQILWVGPDGARWVDPSSAPPDFDRYIDDNEADAIVNEWFLAKMTGDETATVQNLIKSLQILTDSKGNDRNEDAAQ